MSESPVTRQPVDLMTANEVARELRVHLSSVLRWAGEGRVPSIRLGRSVRFRRSDVDVLLANGLPATEPEAS